MLNVFESVPRSPNGFTYVFTPQSVLRSLFSSFDMEFPEILTRPLNATRVLGLNDTLPVDLDVNTTASAGATLRWSIKLSH